MIKLLRTIKLTFCEVVDASLQITGNPFASFIEGFSGGSSEGEVGWQHQQKVGDGSLHWHRIVTSAMCYATVLSSCPSGRYIRCDMCVTEKSRTCTRHDLVAKHPLSASAQPAVFRGMTLKHGVCPPRHLVYAKSMDCTDLGHHLKMRMRDETNTTSTEVE